MSGEVRGEQCIYSACRGQNRCSLGSAFFFFNLQSRILLNYFTKIWHSFGVKKLMVQLSIIISVVVLRTRYG